MPSWTPSSRPCRATSTRSLRRRASAASGPSQTTHSRLLGARIEAHSAAESRIRDTDCALESARLARAQILQESAIAVLGQANANMRIVLRLLEQGELLARMKTASLAGPARPS